ncbi:hypothetical protein EB840_24035 [Klebsiella quasipneumoniae]|nr:hypothetical protein EB840_24035 [Klebsiella quasipneumoniae]
MLCHGTVCVVGKIRDLILQLSKSSIYSTKPVLTIKAIPAGTITLLLYVGSTPTFDGFSAAPVDSLLKVVPT